MNKIKEIPKQLRPYERCLNEGPHRLSDVELLSVLLRTGTKDADVSELAMQLLSMGGEGINTLMHHSIDEFASIKGIGRVKATQLVCMAELAKRMWRAEARVHYQSFDNPSKCATYYMQEMRHLDQEEIRVAFLDKKHNLKCDKVISKGSYDRTIASSRDIFMEALKHKAFYIVLVHNHPSGNPDPSADDKMTTKRISEAGKILGISLADHIIIGDNRYYSFKEWGELQ